MTVDHAKHCIRDGTLRAGYVTLSFIAPETYTTVRVFGYSATRNNDDRSCQARYTGWFTMCRLRDIDCMPATMTIDHAKHGVREDTLRAGVLSSQVCAKNCRTL